MKTAPQLREETREIPPVNEEEERSYRIQPNLLDTLFIVEVKTGKMPNNIGPTVNKMLKDIMEK